MQEEYGFECEETGQHARVAMKCCHRVSNGSSRLHEIFPLSRGNSNEECSENQADLNRHGDRLHSHNGYRYDDKCLDQLCCKDHFDGELLKQQHPDSGQEGDGWNNAAQYLRTFEQNIKQAFVTIVFVCGYVWLGVGGIGNGSALGNGGGDLGPSTQSPGGKLNVGILPNGCAAMFNLAEKMMGYNLTTTVFDGSFISWFSLGDEEDGRCTECNIENLKCDAPSSIGWLGTVLWLPFDLGSYDRSGRMS
mmetsp:Transcript_5690/g.15989  ORF Transcript_5690/g.15989 Transcript_5690/m.15989 type:complete len:249 (+) Transcript_5690:2508-3254(+)